MHLLVLNGPNLNLLGLREPDLYGAATYLELVETIETHAAKIGVLITVRQSNHEGALVDAIQDALGKYDGIVINPAAYTHTSIALLDAVKAVRIPTVEVHLSDPDTREEFRRISYVRQGCAATIKGKGFQGYIEAIDLLVETAALL
ncbi:type II 3-dehydroquinate dehydratase [Christensenellaceae bacterium OttesenSCG-928-M15]|nr:type II 3-dehydroquinate dehydratase [Christensenellaceae bacterium OttesenSCG-928-M15]